MREDFEVIEHHIDCKYRLTGINYCSCPQGWPKTYEFNIDKIDMVNHPSHYNKGKIEVLDFIEDQNMSFNQGSIIKYISRYKHKGNPVQDLEKAQFYLTRLIEQVKNEKNG